MFQAGDIGGFGFNIRTTGKLADTANDYIMNVLTRL